MRFFHRANGGQGAQGGGAQFDGKQICETRSARFAQLQAVARASWLISRAVSRWAVSAHQGDAGPASTSLPGHHGLAGSRWRISAAR